MTVLAAGQNTAVVLPFRQNPVRAAVRFPVRLQLAIKALNGEFIAYTENVSASGLLFVCEQLPLLEDAIAFLMVMPAEILGTERDVRVHCTGRIVRRERSKQLMSYQETRAAVMIDEYHLRA